jgi:carboxyl-terminal processing protease
MTPLDNPRRWCVPALMALLLASVATNAQERATASADGRFDDVVDRIASDYWTPLSRTELEHRALRALVADLDPYGRVFDAAEWDEFKGFLSATLVGVGVELHNDEALQVPRIQHLLIDSAAGAAGARPGDWIEQVDGRDTTGLSFDAFLPMLRGTPGSKVRLTLRSDAGSRRMIEVTRKAHRIPSVHGVARAADGRADFILDARRGIGYVRIARLAEDAVADVRTALADLRAARGCGLVLDLRGSEGGRMEAGIAIADMFLADGLIAGTQARSATTTSEADPAVDWDGPMVVLIDAETASSSEFLAAALRDHRRGTFVGQRTFGKGLVQEMFSLDSGGGLILSVGRHVRPSGIAADRNDPAPANANAGVAPDDGQQMAMQGDEQVQWRKAIDLRASPAIVSAQELAALGPDRILAHALTLLPNACPNTGVVEQAIPGIRKMAE